jgi:hypothetical protein
LARSSFSCAFTDEATVVVEGNQDVPTFGLMPGFRLILGNLAGR